MSTASLRYTVNSLIKSKKICKIKGMAIESHLCIVHATATKTMNNIYEQPSYLLVSLAMYYSVSICLLVLIELNIISNI